MELKGTVKTINETKTFGTNNFRKRELVLETTEEQYPQLLLIEFVQDKCDILDNYNEGDVVNISINLRGREWINPEGKAVYFNSIQGWRIEASGNSQEEIIGVQDKGKQSKAEDDLPF